MEKSTLLYQQLSHSNDLCISSHDKNNDDAVEINKINGSKGSHRRPGLDRIHGFFVLIVDPLKLCGLALEVLLEADDGLL